MTHSEETLHKLRDDVKFDRDLSIKPYALIMATLYRRSLIFTTKTKLRFGSSNKVRSLAKNAEVLDAHYMDNTTSQTARFLTLAMS